MKLIKHFFRFLLLLLLFACSCNPKETAEKELIAADQAFNRLCSEKGLAASFIEYADDSVIKMNQGRFPVIGKEQLKVAMSRLKFNPKLQWEPVKAVASNSGDLGFTFGNWKLAMADTTIYGNYVTIWKKQKDGTWKYVLDGGNETPKPAK